MNLMNELEKNGYDFDSEVKYAIEGLGIRSLDQSNTDTLLAYTKSSSLASKFKGGDINISELVKGSGLDQELVKIIDILANRLNFYMSLSRLLDIKCQILLKVLDELKLNCIKEDV